ncbi:MAG TPA: sugar kinase [Steroidobacteraceae bacterium]|jgi:2-dehydro-3-deoxygluconokinase
MTRVVCIGECMVELRAVGEDSFARSYAGDVYNTAVYLKRSLPQAQVQFVSAAGDDAMSATMRRVWRADGIDDSLAFTVSGGSPGLYLIETDAFGERRFQYWRSQSAARRWLALLLKEGESRLWGADIVYLSGITLAILAAEERQAAIDLMNRLRAHVGRIAFDPNVRLKLWESPAIAAASINAAISACDILLPSTEDLVWLLQVDDPSQQLQLLRAMGVSEVALTLGAKGCAVADAETHVRMVSPAVERVLDTSGAGDSFNGAYLAARLQGNVPAKAAEAAMLIASRVVTHAGAIVPAVVSHPQV